MRLGFLQNKSFPTAPNETSSVTSRSASLLSQPALSSEKAVGSPPCFQPLIPVLSPDVSGIEPPDRPGFIKHKHSHSDRSPS